MMIFQAIKLFKRRDDHGMALLMTLMIIAVLMTLAVEFTRYTREAAVTASASGKHFILQQMAYSGLNAAMVLLAKDRSENDFDTLNEDWASSAKLRFLADALAFDEGKVDIEIIDERSRLQVNALVKFPDAHEFNAVQAQLWDRFLHQTIVGEQFDREGTVTALRDALKDWMDAGDDDAITGLNGAESDYYLSLVPPYTARNGPLVDIKEIWMIRGFSPDLFRNGDTVIPLTDLVTVAGAVGQAGSTGFNYDGRINLNTAPEPVLAALLPAGYEHFANAMVEFRAAAQIDFSSSNWYRQVPGLQEITLPGSLLTTQSDFFAVKVFAFMGEKKITIRATLVREPDAVSGKYHCRLLGIEEVDDLIAYGQVAG